MRRSKHATTLRSLALAAAVSWVGVSELFAQQAAAPAAAAPEPPKKWETTASAGLSLASGNSDSLLVTVGLQTGRKWAKDEVSLGISGAYGESKAEGDTVTRKTQEIVSGFGQYNRLFTERFYGGVRLDAMYDGIAGVDYRVKISPLAGYYLVKTPKTSLAVEVGPSVVFEQLRGQSEKTYLGVRFGERFEHKLTATTKIWESVEYVPRVDKWTEKYLITGEVGVDAGITKHVSLRAVFQDFYDSEPAPGRKNNDLRLIAGIAYKF